MTATGLFKVTQRRLIVLLVLAGLAIASSCFWLGWNKTGSANKIGGPFTLINGDGRLTSDSDFRGRYMLVYFGYTFCPDVCPTTLSSVTTALDELGTQQAQKIQPIFITVDPSRDTPKIIKDFTSAFSPDIVGLTGSPQQIDDVAKEYHVYYAAEHKSADQNRYTVDHNSILYLMNPSGQFVTLIPADATPETIAEKVRQVMG